ncbi:MAG: Eco29kI family restriction endonuclease [Verrucomicrobiae bacterium]|nr:Eco29kI family restriction endonuclease [Verrucomicrobiae bacterium]
MTEPRVFNPLDKLNLGNSIVDALLEAPIIPLGEIKEFNGAGIYAIYYSGSYAAYAPLSERNRTRAVHPIYVGKAIPKGGRKGSIKDASIESNALAARLREHAESIRAVKSLNIADFTCRHLVVDDIWISLGETLLIHRFEPLWNQVVDGFGNHDPGSGRYNGKRPVWDELHPGRAWAAKCQAAKQERAEVLGATKKYMDRFKK